MALNTQYVYMGGFMKRVLKRFHWMSLKPESGITSSKTRTYNLIFGRILIKLASKKDFQIFPLILQR